MRCSHPDVLADPLGRCFAIPQESEWLIFAPDSALLFRANWAGAKRFLDMPTGPATATMGEQPGAFSPTSVTVSPSNSCGQACVYCYGTPAHSCGQMIDVGFCRAGARLVARCAQTKDCEMRVFFHGVGEPTADWPTFLDCVGAVREAAAEHNAKCFISLCTGGQLSRQQAGFVADSVDSISVSLDGPADIQRRQRSRRDGRDSFMPAAETARLARDRGRHVTMKATVTADTVDRLEEIVEFAASEIGSGTEVHLGEVEVLPWTPRRVSAPSPEAFLGAFWRARQAGMRLRVHVGHPDVRIETLCQASSRQDDHFCLTPHGAVTAFYDIPGEGSTAPTAGAYGCYDAKSGEITIDEARRRALRAARLDRACAVCIARNSCYGLSGVRGRVPQGEGEHQSSCIIRTQIALRLLREASSDVKAPGSEVRSHALGTRMEERIVR